MNTIGESAAQGAAGIIIWGRSADTASKVSWAGAVRPHHQCRTPSALMGL